ncbi:Type I restriction-modification system, specificity subunit S [uncultured Candidatus Thioglobus sp.]|nr:Type I restriction-modification system, specificity subunit S [uncultured Candidatus Thioglobus sp.]
MSSHFQLSPELDRNKVFLVKCSELEGRMDANTYHPKRTNAIRKIINSKYSHQKLGLISTFSKIITSSIIDTDIYVGLENIESDTGVFIESSKKETISSAAIFTKGQVLFPKLRPYLNKVFYACFSGICSTEFHVLDSSIVANKFLAYFLSLDVVVIQTSLLMSGNTLPRLQTEDIKNLLIPIPPKEIQTQIVAKMDTAYAIKKQKEAEAQRLLDSIDDYLLDELGIELPEQEENTIQNRMFTRQLSEVSGGRFDPNYHFNIELITGHSANFEFIKLKDIIKYLPQYGANEPAVDGIRDCGIRYIRITDISENGELNNNSWKTAATIEDQYLLHYNDLLFARSGSVGRAYLHKDITEDSIFAGYLIRFIIDEAAANPDYIFFYCHSVIYKLWVNAIYRPAVQANINAEEYKSLPVPLPPIEKQTEIANHITKIRNQAKTLQQQAKAELEQAKKEVETMILGADEKKA